MARAIAPVVAVAVAGAAWALAAPATADMAAHAYRAWLWDSEGFAVYDAQWYGGHHVPGYSLLFPPLGAWFGARLAVVAAGVAAAAALTALARGIDSERREAAAWLLAAGAAANLVVGRGPFLLGVAIGALALVLRERRTAAPLAAAACAAASPVAGLFLALIGAGLRSPRLAVPPLAVIGILALGFPEGGSERFVATAFWPMAALTAAAVWMLPTLRAPGLLYLGLLAGVFLVDSPVGQNAVRLGVLAGPAALLLAGRGPRPALLAVGAGLLYLQVLPAVRAVSEAHGDPSTERAFHAPLLRFLDENAQPGDRIEVVFTRNHWEAAYVAPHWALARGWERQLDLEHNRLFYDDEPLTPERYRRWLRDSHVQWVALPAAPLDFSAREEARLVASGPPYLREARAPVGWRVFRTHVPSAPLIVATPTSLATAAFIPGRVRTGRRHSPYWRVVEGDACPVKAPGGWLELDVRRPGVVRAEARLAPLGNGCGPG